MLDRWWRPVSSVTVIAVTVTIALLASVSAALLPAVAEAQQSATRRLQAARDELAALAGQIEEAEGQADRADAELADAEEQLHAVEAIVNEVAAAVDEQRAAVADARRRLQAVEQDAEELDALFAARVAQLYKQGPQLTLEVLLSSEGAEQALARTSLLERVAAGDQVDLEVLGAAETAVVAERERLATEQARLEATLEEQREILTEATRLRETRRLAAAETRQRLRGLHDQQDDLESEQERLEAVIRRAKEAERRRETERRREAERRASARSAAGAASGGSAGGRVSNSGYAWPMCAPVTSGYGPRWGRMHRGIDQGAPRGSAIGASKAGTVIFAGWQGGYGRLVLIDHGDGVVTAYAHMSGHAVGAGRSVSRGQTIGYVGSTGNSTGPHLHFETRVNGSAVNPRQYLSGGPC